MVPGPFRIRHPTLFLRRGRDCNLADHGHPRRCRKEDDGSLTSYALFGLDDQFGLILRPNQR
jgi:hypothetical protein